MRRMMMVWQKALNILSSKESAICTNQEDGRSKRFIMATDEG